MKRVIGVVVVVVAALGSWSATAWAQTGTEVTVTGSFTATGGIRICEGGASPIGTVSEGTAELTPLGSSTIYFETCADLGTTGNIKPVLPGSSVFSITTSTGGLSGDVGGEVDPITSTPQGFAFHLLLNVTAGTGQFAGATGTLVLDGFFGIGAATANGTVSGVLRLTARTPQSKVECKNGGWRNLADDQGQPFRNQGQCVSYVVAHRP